MDPFGWKSVAIAGAVCSLMATRAVRKRSLTPGGAAAGFLTGFLLISCGLRGLVLLVFYQCGSWATKYQLSLKMRRDATLQSHAQRGATQVLCVSGLACLLQLWHAVAVGAERPYNADNHALATRLACAVTAHHATGLADTLASELGILASSAANRAHRARDGSVAPRAAGHQRGCHPRRFRVEPGGGRRHWRGDRAPRYAFGPAA